MASTTYLPPASISASASSTSASTSASRSRSPQHTPASTSTATLTLTAPALTRTDSGSDDPRAVDVRLGKSWAAKEARARAGVLLGRDVRNYDDGGDDDLADSNADTREVYDHRGRLDDGDGEDGERRMPRGVVGDGDRNDDDEDGDEDGRSVNVMRGHGASATTTGVTATTALPGIRDLFPDHLFEQQALKARSDDRTQSIRSDPFAFDLSRSAGSASRFAPFAIPVSVPLSLPTQLPRFPEPSKQPRPPSLTNGVSGPYYGHEDDHIREARPHASPLTALTALTAQTSLAAASVSVSASSASQPLAAPPPLPTVRSHLHPADHRARLDTYSFPRANGPGAGPSPTRSPVERSPRRTRVRTAEERESLGTSAAAAGLLGLSLSAGPNLSPKPLSASAGLAATARADAMDVDGEDSIAHHAVSLSLSSVASAPSFSASMSYSSAASASMPPSDVEDDEENDEDELEEDELLASDVEDDRDPQARIRTHRPRARFARGSSDGSGSGLGSGNLSGLGETTTAPTSVDESHGGASEAQLKAKFGLSGNDGGAKDNKYRDDAQAGAASAAEDDEDGANGSGTVGAGGGGRNWKRHTCPHCRKRFNRPSSLKIHLNTHTGEKPFECPHPGCGRQFNVSSNMRRHYRNHQTVAGIAPVPIPMGAAGAMVRPPYGHVSSPHAYAAGYERMRMRAQSDALAGYERQRPPAPGQAPPSAYRIPHSAAAEAVAGREHGSLLTPPPHPAPPGYDPYAYAEHDRVMMEMHQIRAEREQERLERERSRMPSYSPGYARPSYYPPYGSPEAHARQVEYSRVRSQAYLYPYPAPPSHMYSQSVPQGPPPPHDRAQYGEAPVRPPVHSASPPLGLLPLAPTDWPQRGHAYSQSAPVAYPYAREKQVRPPSSAAQPKPAPPQPYPPMVRERRDSTVANTGHDSEPEPSKRELDDINMDDEVAEIPPPKGTPQSPAAMKSLAQRSPPKEYVNAPGSASSVYQPNSAPGPSPQNKYAKPEPARSSTSASSPNHAMRSKSHSHSYSSPHIASPPLNVAGRDRGLSHSRNGSTSSSGHGHGVHPYARPPGVRHAHSLSRDLKERGRGYELELPPLPPAPPYARAYAPVPELVYSSGYGSGSASGSAAGSHGASPYMGQNRALYNPPSAGAVENGQRR